MIADPKTERALYFLNGLLRALHSALPNEQMERQLTVRMPGGTTHISLDAGLLKAIAETNTIHQHLSSTL